MHINARQPIGIFDSGIGGLTVAARIIRDFPNEDILYFGDTAHLPYGDKSKKLITGFSQRISEFLIEKGCKLIIIACNTASAVAYQSLVDKLGSKAHFVNVVDPAVRGIAGMKNITDIGIIGTQRTIDSGVYPERLKKLNPHIRVHTLATPLLAPMIEAGFFNHQISRAVIETYLRDAVLKNIGALMLACTHYPLIKKEISEFYKTGVNVFDSTDFISEEVGTILEREGLKNHEKTMRNHFYVSDLTGSFEQTTRLFFGEEIDLEFCPLWDKEKKYSL